jgi:two-component system, OmpR family, sensor histidine kinase CpxA
MRSLSLKIFLWFWLAVLVGGLAFICVALLWPSQTFIGRAAKYFAFNLETTGRMGIDLYEQSGPSALNEFLGSIETISAFKLYILTAQGDPLKATAVPSGARALGRRALSTQSVQAQNWTTHPLIAQPVVSASGRAYTVLLELPEGLAQVLIQMSHALFLRIAAALLASGLVCFLMVRYVTSPIRKLQAAVRKFARGDLSVRVASGIGRRQDEIADLGRDFDAMAMRIESLMHAHENLLRDVAHELRSPLTRLNVALEIARKHGDAKMSGFLDRIGGEARQLSHLITQVLVLSRLENIEVERHLEPICLESLIEPIVRDANFEGQMDASSVTFDCRRKVTLTADGRLVHSAIENIVRNALRFSPPGSPVEIIQQVEASQDRSVALVVISDRGPGVPPEALENLFKPFFRVAAKKGRPGGGAGVGMAIAYHAVNLHRGAIRAVNRANGGLTVEIRLPMRWEGGDSPGNWISDENSVIREKIQ